MRVLAIHPETADDLRPRQPLYSALSAAGHELTLVVCKSLAAQVPAIAPGAKVLTLTDTVERGAGQTNGAEASELIEAARAMHPEVLLVASARTSRMEERLTQAMPQMRMVEAEQAAAPAGVEGVLQAIDHIEAPAAHANGRGAGNHTDNEAAPIYREVPPGLPDQDTEAQQRIEALERRVQDLESELEAVHTDGFRWLLASAASPDRPIVFSKERVTGLVSVVIPAYNAAAFIERSVRSAWAQEGGGFETEILLCEDGSSDATPALAQELAAQSPVPMRVLRHPDGSNRGVSATRNLGLAAARGEFVALLDADDVWLSRKLAAQVKYLRSHPATQVVCSLGHNRDRAGDSVTGWNGNSTAGDYRHVLPPNDFSPPYTFEQLVRGDPIVNSTLLIRRTALEAVGGYPAMMAHQAEDWLLLAKLALLGPIDLMDAELIDYTVHPDSYTTQYIHHNFAYGSRIEFLFHLVHWMVRQPQYRQRGEQLFRREYPRMVAMHAPAYKLIEDYCRYHNGRGGDAAAFEAHLSGVYAELEQLRLYAGEREWIMNLLRKIPGLRTTYGILRQAKRKR